MSRGKAPCHISSRRHLKGSNARFETSARERFRTCDRFCAHLVRTNWRARDFKTEGTGSHFVPQRNASTSPTWWRTFYGFPGFLHPSWTALYHLTHPHTHTRHAIDVESSPFFSSTDTSTDSCRVSHILRR